MTLKHAVVSAAGSAWHRVDITKMVPVHFWASTSPTKLIYRPGELTNAAGIDYRRIPNTETVELSEVVFELEIDRKEISAMPASFPRQLAP